MPKLDHIRSISEFTLPDISVISNMILNTTRSFGVLSKLQMAELPGSHASPNAW
jgi:hypothetical protein